ncbi:carboxypeptidase-like regulatory domain-containing protein [Bremerella sp. P1]|uniref:carboxypeptidase-like regulatory domain-containing protein n=1 Tax=Bremerella sp. P1 TaxID=3026424 RepID=UPI002368965D|nr:carboxypeptidase-like regulatory domain-containing protein [Bremerella sp. P1]WDI40414.1 carboxypeptidase-like regulatory domain-containing protein [Bremerella sp. P1]
MPRIGCLLLLSILLSAATAMAQDRFEAMQYGFVVDERDRPVPDIEVRGLWKPEYRSPFGPSLGITRTDQVGKFVVPLPAGNVSGVEFLASDGKGLIGYIKRGTTRIGEPVWEPVKVVLKSCSKYEVEVKDADGNPSEGIHVSAMPEFLGEFVQQTDAQGKATVLAPIEHKADAILAWDKKRGMDYAAFDRIGKVEPGRISPTHSEKVEMKLTPWKTYSIRVVDLDNKPIAQAALTPEWVHLPRRLTPIPSGTLMTAYTNDNGWATVLIPEDSLIPSINVQKPGYYTYKLISHAVQSKTPIKMAPLMPVKGNLLKPDGSPAEGVWVKCSGSNEPSSSFDIYDRTDDEGSFYLEVPGNSYGIVFAKTDDMAAPAKPLVIHHDQSLEPFILKLKPMARVFGKLADRNGQPLKMEKLSFNRIDGKGGKYFEMLPIDQRLKNGPRHSFTSEGYYTKTDEKGNYDVLLGQGQYEIRLRNNTQHQEFMVDSEDPKELDLRNEALPERVLKGHVVTVKGSECNAARARVQGLAQSPRLSKNFYYATFQTSCDEKGNFETKPIGYPYVVTAKSRDGKCHGLAFVPPDTDEFDIVLAPPMKATGKLVDQEGTPIANRPITAIIEFELDGETHTASSKWGTTTDAQGRFELTGLVAGQKYTVRVLRDAQPGEIGQRLEFALHFTTQENNVKQDLGEVKVASPKK